MVWMKRAGGYDVGGFGRHRLQTPVHFPVFEPPAFTHPGEVTRTRYRSEPCARAELPEHGTVDAKITGISRTHVLLHWATDGGVEVHNVWVPAGWVTRINRDESTWRDPYDKLED
ncbi:hypothetical protein [uncultured Citricoccus sp.]|uniref:hypothetical protein n=1 Tax=uncultured Citricoccus sp. TaxID=614031 RepID=UPI002605558E|nr:hypothetical protein [uncultured Citricoccus sp.]